MISLDWHAVVNQANLVQWIGIRGSEVEEKGVVIQRGVTWVKEMGSDGIHLTRKGQ